MALLDYQALMYAPSYAIFGQPATLTTSGGTSVAVTAVNKTGQQPTPFAGFGVEFQANKPYARVRMAEILAAGLSPVDDVVDGTLAMAGHTWSIKSFEYIPSPVGINDGELQLILKDDLNA